MQPDSCQEQDKSSNTPKKDGRPPLSPRKGTGTSWETLLSTAHSRQSSRQGTPTKVRSAHFEDDQFDSNDESFGAQAPRVDPMVPSSSSEDLRLVTPKRTRIQEPSPSSEDEKHGISREPSAQLQQILSMDDLIHDEKSSTSDNEPITQQEMVSSCDSLLAFEIIEPFDFDVFAK